MYSMQACVAAFPVLPLRKKIPKANGFSKGGEVRLTINYLALRACDNSPQRVHIRIDRQQGKNE